MKPFRRLNRKARRPQKAQIMVLFALLLPVMIFFIALGMDMSLVYITKSRLSRAVDGVALRMAHKFNSDAGRRKELALSYMQANMSGYLNGATTSTFTSSGTVTGSTGETLTATVGGDTLQINTKASSAQGAITVTVSASTTHETFFMRLAGAAFEKFNFTESATATRFPAVNILILDLSGSMLNNGGAEGLITGVNDFMAEFDEDRDFMLIIGFSDKASVLWPNVEYNYGDSHTSSGVGIGTGIDTSVGPITGLHYYKPSRDFISGLGGSSSNSVAAVMTETAALGTISYYGNTNGAEGLRLGSEFLQKWLENDVADSVRDDLQINFIFFTDGEFNAVRTYAKGPGFGTKLDSYNTDDTYSPSRMSIHNTFHDYNPIVAEDYTKSYGGVTLNTIFGTASGGKYGSAKQMPGINTSFYWTYSLDTYSTNSSNHSKHMQYDDTVTWRDDALSGGSVRSRWENQLYFPYRSYAYMQENAGNNSWSGSIASALLPASSTSKSNQFRSLGFLINDASQQRMENGSSADEIQLFRAVSNSLVQAEKFKQRYAYFMYFPVSATNAYTNAARGTSYSSTATRDGVTYYPLPAEVYTYWNSNAKSNKEFDYFPASRCYTNHYDSYYRDNYSTSSDLRPTPTKQPWIYKRTWGNTGHRDRWFRSTMRVADYYLDYTIGGQPDFNGDTAKEVGQQIGDPYASQMKNAGTSSLMNDNLDSGDEGDFIKSDSDHQPKIYQWWKFSTKSWTSGNASSESYWLTQAQGYVLRKQFDATIYTVIYGDNGSQDQMKNLANDSSAPAYDSTQNEGKYYKTNEDSSELSEVFRDIAHRIAVKLTD